MRRKKKDGDAEKASSEQPQQAPLQPDFYEAQGAAEPTENLGNQVRETASRQPEPVSLPPIDDDNRWNRIDADPLPPPPRSASSRSSFERPPRRQAPARVSTPRAPRVVSTPEPSEGGSPERPSERSAERPAQSAEGREAGPGRGRRRRGRRGRGRAKPSEVSMDGASPAPLRPSSMSDPMSDRMADPDFATPRPQSRAAVAQSDPNVPKKYKGVVVLSIGLPGSGKSSWFKRNNITPLSSDLLRGLLFDDPNEQRFQDLVFSNLRSLLRARLVARRPMNYVDATNLSPHERQGWIKLAHDYGYEVHAVYFDVPLEVCLDRNRKRQRVVAEDVMRRMGSKLQAPTFEEGFTKITNVRVKKKEGDESAPVAEVIDLSASAEAATEGHAEAHSEAAEEVGMASESAE